MSKYRGGPKPWDKPDDQGRSLDTRQFPELNATFYTARPADLINMRINMLSLVACSDEVLASAFASERRIGDVFIPGGDLPSADDRDRYLQMEAMMIVHHASEALLRLFFAHVDHPECPWISMSASTNFNEFKDRVGAELKAGFNPEQIATVFLGGSDPNDAAIEVTQEEFNQSVEGVDRLLWDCALRILQDAFLYNGVKHGLTAIALSDKSSKMTWTVGEKNIVIHRGALHAFLHRLRFPTAKKNEKQWFFSIADANPQRDVAVTRYIAAAIGSLWAVARRRYMGAPGSILCFSKDSVEVAIYLPIEQSLNAMKRMTSELAKLKSDGEVDGIEIDFEGYNIPDKWEMSEETPQKSRRVQLPVRQQDKKIYSMSNRSYLPFSPKGFQSG
ncbi:hypothetical protein Mycsm_01761 [Mycobacterium sp. JS623]|uniref:hypothetical protein n=1 Tax=Mycobacterium sp. JS623 TaxID=212767 RepID=UPI0002A561A1|nr:hypothetical protein [Mycobacterium sp. JS623]AGB22153.1 hypothetical protein Mycsm_01761 [Mycobacterium sp. JS623]